MNTYSLGVRAGVMFALLWMCIMWVGCGPRTGGYPDSVIDTTEHRVYNGFMFIKMGRPEDAQREFELGLSLNPGSSAAYRGMGIVHGMKGNFNSAFALMAQALTYAKTNDDKALSCTGMIRLHTMQKGMDWLAMAEEDFRQALSFSSDLPDAHFQLGIAYKNAYRIADSRLAFAKVVELNKYLVTEAREQIHLLKKLEKSMPRSELGKAIILVDRLTRAHAAGLLSAETRIDQFFRADAATAQKGSLFVKEQVIPSPTDVAGHPLREEIEKVIQLRIQGLGTFNDGTFRPNEHVTRAGFAVIVAAIISRVPGASSFSPSSLAMHSPFKDVRSDATYFNAIIICTQEAGVMEVEGDVFDPMGTLSGVDALLVLRRVEEKLKIP